MSAQAPEISVVIPCWNVSPWLARCLDSVFAALPEGAEAIAVDDGSTDDTLAILRKRAESEPRLRVVPLAHRGVSAARNAALDLARGRLLFFVDPDDLVAPDYFSAMSAALDRDRADICVCAFSGSRLKGDYRFGSGEAIRAGYLPRVFGYSFDDVRAWYAGKPLFADREMASACRMAFRRAVLDGIRFDETIELYEDAMFVSGPLGARDARCDRAREASAPGRVPLPARIPLRSLRPQRAPPLPPLPPTSRRRRVRARAAPLRIDFFTCIIPY